MLALGDEFDGQLIINGESAQLIAEDIVKYASPKKEPKILVVLDSNHNGESSADTAYISTFLLRNYQVTFINEPRTGLMASHLDGYDLVWFNNPGHPMGKVASRDALMAFTGGVILSGDDLARGSNFSLAPLTGLTYVDNGTRAKCGNKTYNIDNNRGSQYVVSLEQSIFPGVDSEILIFKYGNDIDSSKLATNQVEVLAYATAGVDCKETRPVIVRYEK